jgi:hypothetical protein
MVANQASIDMSPGDQALDMVSRMEALAVKGEWTRVEQLAVRLKSAILDTPEDQRQSLVMAVNRHFERVQTLALVSRGELKDKLSEIRRGRIATRAYGQPRPLASNATLR